MSVSVTVNNTTYTIPQTGETGWGDNVTSWIQAVSSSTLQKSGGTFTLSAEVDFGASFGLKSLYFKGRNSNPSSAGILRLANTDSIGWRNAANSGDKLLAVNSSDQLTYAGTVISSSSGVTPVAAGGTGIASYTAGDLLYASATTTLSKLAIGTAGQILKTNGGATAPEWGSAASTLATVSIVFSDSPYTILNTTDAIFANTASGAIAATLPANASNAGKVFKIKKTSSDVNAVTISRAGSDTIQDVSSGLTSTTLNTEGEEIEIVSLGTGVWQITSRRIPSVWVSWTPTGSWVSNTTYTGFKRRVGDTAQYQVKIALSAGPTAATLTITQPTGETIDTAKLVNTTASDRPQVGLVSMYSSGTTFKLSGSVAYASSTTVQPFYMDDSASGVATDTINATTPVSWQGTDTLTLTWSVPISGWNG